MTTPERIGRYEILSRVAAGGQATVYRAQDSSLGRVVALKVLHPHLSDDAQFLERFVREARVAATLSHPNAVVIYEVGEDAGRHFITMEYLPQSLHDLLTDRAPLSVDEAIDLVRPVALALDVAHQGEVIHRDLKPQNILISEDGVPKVTDFGIARAAEFATMTATGLVMGTPAYMSPEQAKGERVDARTDVYALGIILFEALTAHVPLEGLTPQDIMRHHLRGTETPLEQLDAAGIELDAEVKDLLQRVLAIDPDDRPASAGAFAEALDTLFGPPTAEDVKPPSHVESVALAPDGATLASGSKGNTIRLWDVAAGEEIWTASSHSDDVFSVAFSPDGATFASGSRDNTIKLWDVATGEEIRTLTGHDDAVMSVAFSPDGAKLASGSWDQTIKLWDVATGEEIWTASSHGRDVRSVAFSPDGATLASGSNDIKLWDVATGEEIRTLTGHDDAVESVAFSPDGAKLASGSWDQTIKLWDAASGEELRTLTSISRSVSTAFSPDGGTLASGANMDIKLWDAASGEELRTLTGHDGGVWSVAFSPDGATLASGSYDQTIKLWDVATGEEIRTLTGHYDAVTSVAFSRYGATLASGSYDGTIKLWNVAQAR